MGSHFVVCDRDAARPDEQDAEPPIPIHCGPTAATQLLHERISRRPERSQTGQRLFNTGLSDQCWTV
jgi:hypothetical protein